MCPRSIRTRQEMVRNFQDNAEVRELDIKVAGIRRARFGHNLPNYRDDSDKRRAYRSWKSRRRVQAYRKKSQSPLTGG